jgi:methyl-accepting chemotaxis protein
MIKNIKIKTKLLVTFLLIALLPLGLVTFIALDKANKALNDEAIAKFAAVQQTKRSHLEDYFKQVFKAIVITKDDPFLHQCVTSFNDAYQESENSIDNDDWRIIVEFKEPRIKEIVADNEFNDLLLISNEGNIVYSAAKGAELGVNIPGSKLAESSLGRAYEKMVDGGDVEVVIGDFAAYQPDGGIQAAFMMARLIDEQNESAGYVAIRLTGDQINAIVQQRIGLGETGESYLVGKFNGETSLRSDRVIKKGKIGKAKTDKYIELALKGESGSAIKTGSTGAKEFVRYDPVDIPGLNWALITTAATEEVFAAVSSLRNRILMATLLIVVFVIGTALVTVGLIVKPIKQTAVMLQDIAEGEGDLTMRLQVTTEDEIGDMAKWFNLFIDKLQSIIGQIANDANTLNESSTQLSSIAGQMTTGAEGISKQSEQVAASAAEMSDNMNSVAAASEQAATNVDRVASATEEMTATVNEIAQNSEKARTISETAVSRAGNASVKVNELGHAAGEIDKVTEVITQISEQTNLLALNATIEAARAGEAGKGFAVVANEIKELAQQTAKATLEIKDRIRGIQVSTEDTVDQISEISGVINDVNEIVSTIAAAVEEQAVTSQEISDNVAQGSQGIQDVNVNVVKSSTVAGNISGGIGDVNMGIRNIADSSGEVSNSASGLAQLSENLKKLVDQFKI